jgi:Na+/melibiose symporter-like transporter
MVEPIPKLHVVETAPAPPAEAAPAQLPLATILLYSAPMAGLGFMELLFGMYLMTFATDVLGVAPAAKA